MPLAHIFQHVSFEGPGRVESWLKRHGWLTATTQFWEGEFPPEEPSWDLLIVLGGPMSVHDEGTYPWLKAEKAHLKQAIARGKSMLGICLGAQLLAHVLGSKVYRGCRKEIGWFALEGTPVSDPELKNLFPPTFDAFHWHGETFDLPIGATHLASSELTCNQAFSFGERVIGLQFHLEIAPSGIEALVENCRSDLEFSASNSNNLFQLLSPSAPFKAMDTLLGRVMDWVSRKG